MLRFKVIAVSLVLLPLAIRCAHRPAAQFDRPPRPTVVGKIPATWQPRVDPRTRLILNLPFRKILTTRALLGPWFDCVRKTNEESSTQQTNVACATGVRFSCTAVYDITFDYVGGSVTVSGDGYLSADTGSCIMFRVADPSTQTIRLIDFIDGVEGTTEKPAGPVAIGEHCKESVQCVVYLGLVEGSYNYAATIGTPAGDKILDPEIEVSCTGCGEPPCK